MNGIPSLSITLFNHNPPIQCRKLIYVKHAVLFICACAILKSFKSILMLQLNEGSWIFIEDRRHILVWLEITNKLLSSWKRYVSMCYIITDLSENKKIDFKVKHYFSTDFAQSHTVLYTIRNKCLEFGHHHLMIKCHGYYDIQWIYLMHWWTK